MPSPAKGLYAPRLVDLTFALMGIGSAVLLAKGGDLASPFAAGVLANPMAGLLMLVSVILIGMASCIAHAFDRRGWDDYMGQIVSQSALIAMVTILLSGVVFDFLIAPNFALRAPDLMIQGMVPIACLAWALGYGFLRWKGTNA